MLICTAFCSTLTELIPAVKTPMLIAGAAYMLHLAWATYKSDGVITEDHSRSGFYSGLILQFINLNLHLLQLCPCSYILLFYAGEPFKLTLFALLLAFIGFLFTLCWSAFGSAFRLLFSRHTKSVNTIMALLLVYCAASLFGY
mgnify:CR=1 FL=1